MHRVANADAQWMQYTPARLDARGLAERPDGTASSPEQTAALDNVFR